jgi:hypothetical protein
MKPTKTYTVKSTNPKMSSGAVERLPKYEKGGLVMGGGGSGKKGMAGGGAARVPLGEGVSAVISGGAYNVKEGGKRYKGVEKGSVGMRLNRGDTTVEVSKNYAPQMLPAAPGMAPVMAEERMTSRKPVTSISITKRF